MGSKSEIARLREQLRLEYESAKRGLTGLGAVARHDFITKRQQNIEGCFSQLTKHMSTEQAITILIEVEGEVHR